MSDVWDEMAEAVMQLRRGHWASNRREIIDYLVRVKRFNVKAAPRAADNFIESILFAEEAAAKGAAQKARDRENRRD